MTSLASRQVFESAEILTWVLTKLQTLKVTGCSGDFFGTLRKFHVCLEIFWAASLPTSDRCPRYIIYLSNIDIFEKWRNSSYWHPVCISFLWLSKGSVHVVFSTLSPVSYKYLSPVIINTGMSHINCILWSLCNACRYV